MRAIYLILLFSIILISCSGNFLGLDDYFARTNRKERRFLKSYQETDSICIPKIKFHHENTIWSRVSVETSTIGDSLRLAYSRKFNLPFCESNEESMLIQNYNFRTREFKKNHNSCCETFIVPDFIVTTHSGKNIEGGGGLSFVKDMGNDRHSIQCKLVTTIYQNDTLIYMDNHGFWTEIFSERDEKVEIQIPKIIIDSLVTLSLQEYFKRME